MAGRSRHAETVVSAADPVQVDRVSADLTRAMSKILLVGRCHAFDVGATWAELVIKDSTGLS